MFDIHVHDEVNTLETQYIEKRNFMSEKLCLERISYSVITLITKLSSLSDGLLLEN